MAAARRLRRRSREASDGEGHEIFGWWTTNPTDQARSQIDQAKISRMGLLIPIMALSLALLASVTAIPVERRRAMPCAIAVTLGWILYRSAWLADSPAQLIWLSTGALVKPEHLWAASDAVVGIYCITKAWDRHWGVSLFLLFALQVYIHLMFDQGTVPFPVYASMLNATFYLEIFCLVVGGGGGRVRNMLAHHHVWNRLNMAFRHHPLGGATAEEVTHD